MSVKLKVLRIQANLTLEQLAQRADLTRSYVSKLERGLSAPSVAVGLRIAKALGVGVEELFSSTVHDDVITVNRAPDRNDCGERTHLPRVVSGRLAKHKLVAFVLNPTDEPDKNRPMSHHGGEELLYVLKGRIRLQLAQREEMLRAGDCVHFNSAIPHKITSIGKQHASVLLIATQD
jgi:transcriptional regulator with XRE-family HTH domain